MSNQDFPNYDLAELHTHLGASISPTIYWEIAQEIGFVLPKRDYHEFVEYITLSPGKPVRLQEYFDTVYHKLLDHLSSGLSAVEKGTYEIFSEAYRFSKVRLLELRANPMKHNNNGMIDLDRLIMSMIRGMEKALLAYPKLAAGLIFCLAREGNYATNEIIVEKAIKYRKRGVVGIDVAGPYTEFNVEEYKELFKRARDAGLGVTIHTGEQRELEGMCEIVEVLTPDRIGHGVYAAYSPELMKALVRRGIVLEICPFANLATKTVENIDEIRWILRTFVENNIKFTINTDWAEMIEGNHLQETFSWLLREKILSEDELRQCNELAFKKSFIHRV